MGKKYAVKIYPRASRDIDDIYGYIAKNLKEPKVAESILEILEKAIYSLEDLPERGAIRRVGTYANQGYRQLIAGNYLIIYRVQKEKQEVYIVRVRYGPSRF